ncbi:LacI family DNA-binding transcriptional regulator [Deminuibacter soli]|uniref:LacI family transcriptional regulator n=1 Tax=Deminuibacter soli TaxID=2291815 RepID=A0A3E1NEF0_9BACT|nr:LacI family DNA-binding transcriptional regulator [Deminuibacter soli]RFM26356.1 LacI family transcriptional regulator [Deminuibacter soli]
MEQTKDITIYDIAKAVDLSPATVSRALKDHPAISKKTKDKVTKLAAELGYRANNFASNLRMQRTHTIGIMVHELNSNFITSVIAGIESVTTAAQYDLIIAHSSESYIKEAANARNLFHKRVDGLIASLAYDTTDFTHFTPFERKGIPVIYFDRVETGIAGTKVVIDNEEAGFKAVEHLLQQGCKRIAHVTGNLKRNVYADRLKGHQRALAAAGINWNQSLLMENDLSEQASIDAAHAIAAMQPMPDAAFVTNDFCAAICMQTLKEKGIRIPQDIAFVGFNNDSVAKIVEPGLTTIHYAGFEMGKIVGKNMIDRLLHPGQSPIDTTITLQSDLIVRGSSLKKMV